MSKRARTGNALAPEAGVAIATDEHWMRRALELARHAGESEDEVPVGAVLVRGDEVLGERVS